MVTVSTKEFPPMPEQDHTENVMWLLGIFFLALVAFGIIAYRYRRNRLAAPKRLPKFKRRNFLERLIDILFDGDDLR